MDPTYIIPREIWREIFLFCTQFDLMRLLRVCKHFAIIVAEIDPGDKIYNIPLTSGNTHSDRIKDSLEANPPNYYTIWKYLKVRDKKPLTRRAIVFASRGGHIGLIRKLFARLQSDPTRYFSSDPYIVYKTRKMLAKAFNKACKSGSLASVIFIKDKLKEYLNAKTYHKSLTYGFARACQHLHIAKYLAETGEFDVVKTIKQGRALYNVCKADIQTFEYVLSFVKKDSKSFLADDFLIGISCGYGNTELVKYLIPQSGQIDIKIKDALISSGNMELINTYISEEEMRKNANRWLLHAVTENHIDIVRRLIALGVSNLQKALCESACSGRVEVFKEIHKAYGEIDNKLLYELCGVAIDNRYPDVFKYIYSLNPTYLKQFNLEFCACTKEIDELLLETDPELVFQIQDRFTDMCEHNDLVLLDAISANATQKLKLDIIGGFCVAFVRNNYRMVKHMIQRGFIGDNNIEQVIAKLYSLEENMMIYPQVLESRVDELPILIRIYSASLQ